MGSRAFAPTSATSLIKTDNDIEYKRDQPARILATGRESWAGWVDLKEEPLADDAVLNTARVIASVRNLR